MADEEVKDESPILIKGALPLVDLHAQLENLADDTSVQLEVDEPFHGFGAGLDQALTIAIAGNVGDFAFLLSERAHYDVAGNAGRCCGHSFASGSVLVHGSAGDCLAAFATGGFIAVHNNAADRCGMELAGADVFVRRSVGDDAGYRMRDGALVLGNGAGENVGREMTGGLIFIRGDVKSTAPHVRPARMKDAEALRLSLFLARAGIKGGGADFKVYRPNPLSRP
ncbi:MAG: hypothetical protein R3C53_25535 [Pirellulaceae bacterium]